MILSRSAQYALRVMSFFATHNGEISLRAKDLASEVNIPISYLSKILRHLVSAGLLSAAKGRNGGFKLAKSPAKISFSNILFAVGHEDKIPTCVFGHNRCSEKNPCLLHNRWKEAKAIFEEWGNKTTLQDVKSDIARLSSSELLLKLKKMGCGSGL